MKYQTTKEEMHEIKAFLRDHGQLSHTWLQRKYGLSTEASKQFKQDCEEAICREAFGNIPVRFLKIKEK